jgi:hypothetical protein
MLTYVLPCFSSTLSCEDNSNQGLEAGAKRQEHLKACWGKFLSKSFPPGTPFNNTSLLQTRQPVDGFRAQQNEGCWVAQDATVALGALEAMAANHRSFCDGVRGETFCAPSPVTFQRSPGLCNPV